MLAAVALLAAPRGPVAGQQATFRAGIDLVNLGITVSDRRGDFITNLRAEDFEVIEDGRKQTITYFARGDQSPSAPPLHVGLLFDTSGSMGEDIRLARSAAVRFLNTVSDAVDMTLVDFDTEVRVATYGQRVGCLGQVVNVAGQTVVTAVQTVVNPLVWQTVGWIWHCVGTIGQIV